LIVPLVMGRTLHMHSVSVVFSILTIGTLFGLLGAILAVPVCAIVIVCWEECHLIPRQIDREHRSFCYPKATAAYGRSAGNAPSAPALGRPQVD
jgi:AI-2E family transporter